MTRFLDVDDATVRAMELHETRAHAVPRREVRELAHAVVLFDPADPDPFWNRMTSVRWPDDAAGFDLRLAEALVLFAGLDRVPHIWPSPAHGRPEDLPARLEAHGFRDVGGGHLMVLVEPGACGPLRPWEVPAAVTVRAIRGPADAGPSDADDVGTVLAQSFGALPGREADLADDLRASLDDPRVAFVLVRVDGEPAAAAKATTFDGMTYVSSVGTRTVFRGRGLAGFATRAAVAAAAPRGGGVPGIVYLGVYSGNVPALRLYERLGFASIGEAPDMLLE